jgi:Chlorophyll A-B binding protein
MTPTPQTQPTTQPTTQPKLEDAKFGFNSYAERLNGRAAMMGFVIAIAIECVTRQGVMTWLGFVS